MCQLEGLRCGLEVFSRLTLLFHGKSIPFIWTRDQLTELTTSLELAAVTAFNLCSSDDKSSDEVRHYVTSSKINKEVRDRNVHAFLHFLHVYWNTLLLPFTCICFVLEMLWCTVISMYILGH